MSAEDCFTPPGVVPSSEEPVVRMSEAGSLAATSSPGLQESVGGLRDASDELLASEKEVPGEGEVDRVSPSTPAVVKAVAQSGPDVLADPQG